MGNVAQNLHQIPRIDFRFHEVPNKFLLPSDEWKTLDEPYWEGIAMIFLITSFVFLLPFTCCWMVTCFYACGACCSRKENGDGTPSYARRNIRQAALDAEDFRKNTCRKPKRVLAIISGLLILIGFIFNILSDDTFSDAAKLLHSGYQQYTGFFSSADNIVSTLKKADISAENGVQKVPVWENPTRKAIQDVRDVLMLATKNTRNITAQSSAINWDRESVFEDFRKVVSIVLVSNLGLLFVLVVLIFMMTFVRKRMLRGLRYLIQLFAVVSWIGVCAQFAMDVPLSDFCIGPNDAAVRMAKKYCSDPCPAALGYYVTCPPYMKSINGSKPVQSNPLAEFLAESFAKLNDDKTRTDMEMVRNYVQTNNNTDLIDLEKYYNQSLIEVVQLNTSLLCTNSIHGQWTSFTSDLCGGGLVTYWFVSSFLGGIAVLLVFIVQLPCRAPDGDLTYAPLVAANDVSSHYLSAGRTMPDPHERYGSDSNWDTL